MMKSTYLLYVHVHYFIHLEMNVLLTYTCFQCCVHSNYMCIMPWVDMLCNLAHIEIDVTLKAGVLSDLLVFYHVLASFRNPVEFV